VNIEHNIIVGIHIKISQQFLYTNVMNLIFFVTLNKKSTEFTLSNIITQTLNYLICTISYIKIKNIFNKLKSCNCYNPALQLIIFNIIYKETTYYIIYRKKMVGASGWLPLCCKSEGVLQGFCKGCLNLNSMI